VLERQSLLFCQVSAFLSEAIDREYKTIRVQTLTPALVATNMTYYKVGFTEMWSWWRELRQ